MVKDGGILIGCDAESGKTLFQERNAGGGPYYASPVAANGNIYFTSLENGTITVLKSGGDKPVVSQNPPLGERCSATPAIADNCLYVRTATHL
jgi:outer membrane protein assembly factor BamB